MMLISKRNLLAVSILGFAASSCIPRPQPMTLVLTVPNQPQAASSVQPKPIYIPVPTPAPTAAAPKPVPLPHTIQNYDLVEVTIGEGSTAAASDELLRVQADGTVRLVNGGSVKIAGMARAEAESTVATEITSRQIMSHPLVRILRKQSATAASAPHGPIAPGDVIHLAIHNLKEPGTITVDDTRVDLAGMIDVPLVGQVKVAGLTDPQAADEVIKAYVDHQIMAKPLLDLTTTETAPAGVDPLDWPAVAPPSR